MKRILTLTLLALFVFSMLPLGAYATETSTDYDEIIYLDNGDYITVKISESMTTRATGTREKEYIFHSKNGEALWKAVLFGSFRYDGATASCIASSCDVTIYDSAWSVASKTAGRTGATATAELTMVKKFLGLTIQTENRSLSLTCSPSGQFS